MSGTAGAIQPSVPTCSGADMLPEKDRGANKTLGMKPSGVTRGWVGRSVLRSRAVGHGHWSVLIVWNLCRQTAGSAPAHLGLKVPGGSLSGAFGHRRGSATRAQPGLD